MRYLFPLLSLFIVMSVNQQCNSMQPDQIERIEEMFKKAAPEYCEQAQKKLEEERQRYKDQKKRAKICCILGLFPFPCICLCTTCFCVKTHCCYTDPEH